MRIGRWHRTDGVVVWLVAASLCGLAGHASVRKSGAAEREALLALPNALPTASSRSSSSNTGTGSDLFIPVILTASGASNSFYTSELTLTNRGSQTATLRYTYRAAAGGGNGAASETLAPGRQKIVPNAIDYLRSLGVPIPSSGNRIGTLRVGVSGSSKISATVRTTTQVADGRAGLAYPGVAVADGFAEAVYLCGLRQNRQDRSNVAFQNLGTSGNVTVRATVFSGDSGNSRVFPDVVLAPGGFRQLDRILATAGFTQGYVKVERVRGTAPFYAYGVINDQANSDGSLVFPVTESSLAGVRGQTLPVIIETPNFSSELIVTNFSDEAKAIDFGFVADGIGREDRTARFFLRLAAGEQQILPEIVEELRRRGVDGVGRAGRTLAGAVFAAERRGNLSGVVIGARTGSPGGGGKYSVFYNAVPDGAAFSDTAWIDALQQNEENRSNLALVNTGEVDDSPSVFQLDLYDGATGMLANTVTGLRVGARGWRQIDGILGKYAPGTTQGYVRIQKTSGNNPFLAYGVINDGGAPGQRSGDGAYLPASGARERIDDPGTAPATDREVLEALYEATGGPNWVNNENWLTDAPLGEWFGVTTNQQGRVVSLEMSYWDSNAQQWISNNVSGPIPPELGYLTSLEYVQFFANKLTGPIPPELGKLVNVTTLDFNANDLSGLIPPELGGLAKLRSLSLNSNDFSGPIPPELGGLANLTFLWLGGNHLTGPIPPELGRLSSLTDLSLNGNELTGSIPPSFQRLGQLNRFHFGLNEGLCAPGTTEFVAWLGRIEDTDGPYCNESDRGVLERLYETAGGPDWTNAGGWLETPALEEWYGVTANSLGRVVVLDLAGNGLTGELVTDLGSLRELTALRIGDNALAGRLPLSLVELPSLDELHYAGTGLCAPAALRSWLDAIPSHKGSGKECDPPPFVADSLVVRIVYAIPSNRELVPVYRDAVVQAVHLLQIWYGKELNGITFAMASTVAEVCYLSEDDQFLIEHEGTVSERWAAALESVAHCGPRHHDEKFVWIVYFDVDEPCWTSDRPETLGRGGSGLTMLGRWDLLGLSNRDFEHRCGYGDQPYGRWVGGLGHELGHAFGLPHPPGCEEGLPSCDHEALMWTGYFTWPDTYLRDDEKEFLRASPFFAERWRH